MPRPQDGYFNAAGEPVPGTHDPVNRFMDRTALMYWAYKQGKAGVPLHDRTAIDIGGCVHEMAEHDLRDHSDEQILECAHRWLARRDDLAKAIACFNQYREWRERNHVQPIDIEIPLVSETCQYGGTPDLVADVNGYLELDDFKTSPKPYLDSLVALAAHCKLWEENHPGMHIEKCRLICLPKDGSGFRSYVWAAADLEPHWRLFLNWLEGWQIERECAAALQEPLLTTQEMLEASVLALAACEAAE